MKTSIWLLIATIGIPLISLAESDEARITKLEEELKKMQEANATLLKKLDEKQNPVDELNKNAKALSDASNEESNTKNLMPFTGKTFYGYEDDSSFVYAMFLKTTPNKGVVEIIYTLPYYDQKYRGDTKYKVTKNDGKNLEMMRGDPAEWIYEAQIDSSGNLLNGKRYRVKDGKKDRQDAIWNLYKVK
ncbi:MAG: hypothetical protein EBR01_12830 [Proteobacteria bacterium]|nr:hypothetical protein [Pseudomonadota bacterium]